MACHIDAPLVIATQYGQQPQISPLRSTFLLTVSYLPSKGQHAKLAPAKSAFTLGWSYDTATLCTK